MPFGVAGWPRWVGLLDMTLERLPPGGPGHPVLVQPAVHHLEGGGVQRVEPQLGAAPFVYQPGVSQDSKVPGDGGTADREAAGHFAGREFTAPHQIEDGAAGRVGQGGEDRIGGNHLRNHMVT